jgi:hypothetical protein
MTPFPVGNTTHKSTLFSTETLCRLKFGHGFDGTTFDAGSTLRQQ